MIFENEKVNNFIEEVKQNIKDIQCDLKYLPNIPIENKTYQIFPNDLGDSIDIVFYNLKPKEIEIIINDFFEPSSKNIRKYFSLLFFYNKILHGICSDKFHLHVNIELSDDDIQFKVSSLSQNYESIMLWFNGYSIYQKIDFVNELNNKLTFCINLDDLSYYDGIRQYLNNLINNQIPLEDIKLSNIDEYCTLIKIMKI